MSMRRAKNGGTLRAKELYYITHVENLPSIVELGILSHDRVENENIPYTPIYDDGMYRCESQGHSGSGR